MAITALYNYAASQNGNHEITVVTRGAQSPALLSLTEHVPQPERPAAAAQNGPVEKPSPANPAGLSLTALVERHRAESKHLAESTRSTLACLFRMASQHLDFERDVRDIRLTDLRNLKSQLSDGHKPSTVNDIIFKGLRALFTIAVDDGYIDKSPVEKLKRARKGEPDRQQPTWEQSLQILQSVTRSVPETGLIVGFMRHFGVGQAEIKHLKGEHVDLARNQIHFRRKKTGKPFDVPIFPYANRRSTMPQCSTSALEK